MKHILNNNIKSKIYNAESIFPGEKIGKPGAWYVAVPESYKGFKICVYYNGKAKMYDDWLKADAYRRFPDKWGRGTYTLAYFKWEEYQQDNKLI